MTVTTMAAGVPTFAGFPLLVGFVLRRTLRNVPVLAGSILLAGAFQIPIVDGIATSRGGHAILVSLATALGVLSLVSAVIPHGAGQLRHFHLTGLCGRRLALVAGCYTASAVFIGFALSLVFPAVSHSFVVQLAIERLQPSWHLLLPFSVGCAVGSIVALAAAPSRSRRGEVLRAALIAGIALVQILLTPLLIPPPQRMLALALVSACLLAAVDPMERLVRSA